MNYYFTLETFYWKIETKITSCVFVEAAGILNINNTFTGGYKVKNNIPRLLPRWMEWYQTTKQYLQRHYLLILSKRDCENVLRRNGVLIQANLVNYNICQEHASKNHFKLYLQPANTYFEQV